jgi:precorrin-6B methylase 1
MKYWEIIASNLSRAGWSWGYTTFVDCRGRTLFVVDAHRDDRKRYVVHSDQLLTAFLELERVVG